jgi:hypothetical protein
MPLLSLPRGAGAFGLPLVELSRMSDEIFDKTDSNLHVLLRDLKPIVQFSALSTKSYHLRTDLERRDLFDQLLSISQGEPGPLTHDLDSLYLVHLCRPPQNRLPDPRQIVNDVELLGAIQADGFATFRALALVRQIPSWQHHVGDW